MTVLSVKQLSIAGPQNGVVHQISFDIQQGEWFALVGQSGSGKSMTASAIGQLLPPNMKATGEIWCGGRNLLSLPPGEMREIRGKRVSYIFQDYQGSFTPFHTIGQHFEEVQRTHLTLSKAERRQQANSALISVGLQEEMYDRYPAQLSGGQLQRASIAIALLLRPDLLIADEPTTALDSMSSFRVLELLAKLQQDTGCAILFITHDLRHVRKYADRIAVMKDGHIIETDAAQQVLHQPQQSFTRLLIHSSFSFGNLNPLPSAGE
ncbi:peptide/nickel transport system ATP-binding protein [Paenibacillus phyllosphaerae]|uniref:Peptide/nickel transport system ATP-binding protein n=1 Tax=Paenibacillus phyllosphaerae TaxID=274593 RepID=A0A7W5AZ06_9BACL|nr:ABC transporter ATP-binding protein [Paenibacillus phyllosphaerae]MBB3111382.1 peptide/nickel transport system ATP-binding protein [Paenibacillus phyllosphaerae]